MSETHVFGPTLVSDFRFGWVQEDNYSTIPGGAAPELGLKNVNLNSFPIVSVSQMIQLGASAPTRPRPELGLQRSVDLSMDVTR